MRKSTVDFIERSNRGNRPIGMNTIIADALANYKGPIKVDVLAATIGESPVKVREYVEKLDGKGIVKFNKTECTVTLDSKWV